MPRKLLDKCHISLTPPVLRGVGRGYKLSLVYTDSVPIDIGIYEAMTIRQIAVLLGRIVGDNKLHNRNREEVWKLLRICCSLGWVDGCHQIESQDGLFSFYLTERNCKILKEYDELLSRILAVNRELIDSL